MDEKTADRSKQGYVNLSEYDNIGASPSPRPSAISKLMKPIFALKGKPYQEYLDNSNSGEKDLFYISITWLFVNVLSYCISSALFWI